MSMRLSPTSRRSPRGWEHGELSPGTRVVHSEVRAHRTPKTVMERRTVEVPRTVVEEEQYEVQVVEEPRSVFETHVEKVPRHIVETHEVEEDVLRTRLVPRTVMVEEEYVDTELSYVDVPRTEWEEQVVEMERTVYDRVEREIPLGVYEYEGDDGSGYEYEVLDSPHRGGRSFSGVHIHSDGGSPLFEEVYSPSRYISTYSPRRGGKRSGRVVSGPGRGMSPRRKLVSDSRYLDEDEVILADDSAVLYQPRHGGVVYRATPRKGQRQRYTPPQKSRETALTLDRSATGLSRAL